MDIIKNYLLMVLVVERLVSGHIPIVDQLHKRLAGNGGSITIFDYVKRLMFADLVRQFATSPDY